MKVGILARIDKPQAPPLVRSLRDALSARGVDVLLETHTAGLLGGGSAGEPEQKLAQSCNLVVVLGGDGTILRALHRMGAVPPSALAEACALTRGGVTRLVDRLRVRRLLVLAAAGGEDRRYQTIALTGVQVTFLIGGTVIVERIFA